MAACSSAAAYQFDATIIFCHGLGQTTADWNNVIRYLARLLPSVKWIRPQAPTQPVSMNGGARRPSWFDVRHLPPFPDDYDEAGITDSIRKIEQFILTEVHNGRDPKRIFLVGFSQGAALSLMTGLTTLHDIGGIASLSGWIPHRVRDQIVQNEPSVPIFWAHGDADTEIPHSYALNSVEFLHRRLGMTSNNLTFIQYPGLGHTTSKQELDALVQWILARLSSTTSRTSSPASSH